MNKKVIDVGEPERGDVIVFRYPPQPTISYIKRVVGIPGDHIVFDHGQLTINGQKIAKVPVEFSREKDRLDTPTSIYHKETIGKHTFTMRELEGVNVARQAPYINFVENGKYSAENGLYWEVKIKEGEYFAMGDNRDQSADSRFWGMVPEQNLTGRAFYIWINSQIEEVFQSSPKNIQPAEFESQLLKRLDMNGIRDVKIKEIMQVTNTEGLQVKKEYEVRKPFLLNIDLVLKFEKSFDQSSVQAK